jgi:hypothetical protein
MADIHQSEKERLEKEREKKLSIAQDLCAILNKLGIFNEKETQVMQKSFADSSHENFEEFLLDEGLVEESDLLKALSIHFKVPSFDVRGFFFDTLLVRHYEKDVLLRNGVIPLELDSDDMIIMIASDPEADGLGATLEQEANYPVEYFVGLKRDIHIAINQYYDFSPVTDSDFDDMSMDEEERLDHEAIDQNEEMEDIDNGDVFDKHEDR